MCNGISFSLTVLCEMEYHFSLTVCVQWNIVFPDYVVCNGISFSLTVLCAVESFSLTMLCAMEYHFP